MVTKNKKLKFEIFKCCVHIIGEENKQKCSRWKKLKENKKVKDKKKNLNQIV